MNPYHLTNEIAIHGPGHTLGIATNDADEHGYLDNSGGNRRIEAGIGYDDVGVLAYMISNADPVLLDDDLPRDLDRLREICHDMSDAPEHVSQQGLERLRRVGDAVRREYPAWPESAGYWEAWCASLPKMLADEREQT